MQEHGQMLQKKFFLQDYAIIVKFLQVDDTFLPRSSQGIKFLQNMYENLARSFFLK